MDMTDPTSTKPETLDLPAELFPEEKADPTVKSRDMSVEQTLGVIGHVRATTRARKWRFLSTNLPPIEAAAKIRALYELPYGAAVENDGCVQWAVWSGMDKDGNPTEPTEPAFEKYEPYVAEPANAASAPEPKEAATITLPMGPEQLKSHVATLRELGIKGRVKLPDGTELEL